MSLSDAAVERLRAAAAAPGPASDRYAIVESIGQGGMGTVYLATDTLLGRDVAVKVPNVSGTEELERRLQVEARVVASLEHPGIVPIHDAGRFADGRVFYVMKRVHGRTLQAYLADRPAMAERLRVFERICEPVAFAHARGFIHRDLKPENIMVGAFGEVMVMDWGVAQRLAGVADAPPDTASPETAGTTHPGTIAGTPGFMAPEQSNGGAGIDERADVYGLGALLCFLLTGEAPPPAGDAASLVLARRDIPKPLRAVCARALAVKPADRYPSVTALAADIARYRADEAVDAHRETVIDSALRLGRTHRTAILLVLAYVIMRALVGLSAGR